MRPDLAKLTTERERRGGSYCVTKKHGGRVRIVHDPEHTYDDEFGGFRSSARHRHNNCKELSDMLNPLRGVLRKNLGRPWNAVYSEFCQVLDRRSMAGIHIFDGHLIGRNDHGEITIRGLYVGEDGKVWEHNTPKDYHVYGFYVHPVTGLICYREGNKWGHHPKWSVTEEIKRLRDEEKVTIDGHHFWKIDGCWFEAWIERAKKQDFQPCWTQEKQENWYIERSYVRHPKTGVWGRWHTTEYDLPVRKRSLNKKQIQVVKNYILDRIKELELG